MLDKKVFVKQMKEFKVLFGDISKEKTELYYDYLKQMNSADFIYCCKKIIKGRRGGWFPTVADILVTQRERCYVR